MLCIFLYFILGTLVAAIYGKYEENVGESNPPIFVVGMFWPIAFIFYVLYFLYKLFKSIV